MAPPTTRPASGADSAASRTAEAHPASLDALIGVHPAALRDLYSAGAPADPERLGTAPAGRLLAVEGLEAVHLLTRPVIVAIARSLLPWRGKSFDPNGMGGRNRVWDRSVLAFHCDNGPSELDGRPTLFLRYDGLGHPWPLSRIVDELRSVSEGVAIGPASLRLVRGSKVLFWWGLAQP